MTVEGCPPAYRPSDSGTMRGYAAAITFCATSRPTRIAHCRTGMHTTRLATGLEFDVADLMSEEDIPTLGEVVRELQAWHGDNATRITKHGEPNWIDGVPMRPV